jgi:hypothetical protein
MRYEANGCEVWLKNGDQVHLAVVCKPVGGDYGSARKRARVCADALNDDLPAPPARQSAKAQGRKEAGKAA